VTQKGLTEALLSYCPRTRIKSGLEVASVSKGRRRPQIVLVLVSLSFSPFLLALEPIPELLAALVKIIEQQLHRPVSLRPCRIWADFAIVSNLFRNSCFQA
jgi:hypothetical protein